jgi:hypothetical protein
MEKIMNPERELTSDELNAVSGGIIPGASTDMGQVDTSEATARRPLGTICHVGWASTKPVSVTVK